MPAVSIKPMINPLSIGLLCLNDYKWLGSLKSGLTRLLWLAIATIKQELGSPGVTFLGLGMKGKQYLLSSSEAIFILLAQYIGKQDVKVWQLRWSAIGIA